ncbi:MAG: hypothetical protein RDA78_07855 [Roseibium sp.]|uniref:hypothetical protein n=1 Tax=Roseibium sp. TaxID=1936156 RepID=UPI003D9C1A59
MKNPLANRRHLPLTCALLCSTAIALALPANATDLLISMDHPLFDTTRANGAITIPLDVTTVTLAEGTEINITDAVALEIFSRPGVTVTNNGTLYTSGLNAGTNALDPQSLGYGDGIFVLGSDNARIVNNGLISIGDYFANAIFGYDADQYTVVNSGNILIRPDILEDNEDYASWTATPQQTVNPHLDPDTGLPCQTAGASAGVRINSFLEVTDAASIGLGGHYVVNNGTITSYAVQSRGIYLDGASYVTDSVTGAFISDDFFSIYSTAVNNGTILMIGTTPSNGIYDVSGLRAEANHATLINNGYIEIRPQGFGIDYNGNSGTIINNGTILAFNDNSHGIEHYRNGTTVPTDLKIDLTVNTGLISVQGDNNHGITLSGHDGHDLINYGRVFSRDGYSIDVNTFGSGGLGTDDRNTVYLLDGSILYGDAYISNSSLPYTDFRLGDGLNAAVRFDTTNGNLPLKITSSHGHVVVGDTLYVADLDSYAQQDRVAWSMFSQIQNAIDDGTEARPPAGDFAFNGEADGMANRWARVFGGWVQEPGDDDVSYLDPDADHTPGYTGYSVGTIVGVNKSRLSYFAGVAYSSVSGDEDVSYDTHSGTLFGGVAGGFAERLTASLTAGAAYNNTDRDTADNTVTGGIDTDTANYASLFFSPSLLVKGPIGSSLRVNYLGTWTQGHDFDFSGGTQLDVDGRYSNVIGAQLQMAHNLPVVNETFGTRIRYGVEASYADGQAVGYNLMGTDLETPYDNGFTARGFAALEVGPTYIEAGYNTDEQVSINAGLKLRF